MQSSKTTVKTTFRARLAGGLRWTPLLATCLLLGLTVIMAISVGSVRLTVTEVWQALVNGLSGDLRTTADTIVWKIRLPRALLAALVGASLAISGAAFQGIFRNPLADPYLLGVAGGAGFGATLVFVFGAGAPFLLHLGVPLVGFLTALLCVLLVVALARQGGRVPLVSLILAGVVVGSSLSAATSFLMLMAREQAAGMLAWLLGSFALSSWAKVTTLAPFLGVSAAVIIASARALNLLQLGEEQAHHLGLRVEPFKLIVLTAATLASAAAVSLVGIIGFVGLMVPHAVRLATGPDHRSLLPMSLASGALFMLLADLVARTLIAPAEIPVGVITALVGGPFFLYLLKRQAWRLK